MGVNSKTNTCKLVNNSNYDYYVIDHLEEVQQEMLRLLKIIDDICIANDINYWVDGGSLIGALRHGGFIPWDDDIDISLFKKDYLKLIDILEDYCKDHSDVYLLFAGDNKYNHCCNFLASTKNLYGRMEGEVCLFPIKLDIRPINVIKNEEKDIRENILLRDQANYLIFNKAYFCKDEMLEYQKLTPEQLKRERKKFLKWYNTEYGLNQPDGANTIFRHPYYEFSTDIPFDETVILPLKRFSYDGTMTFIPKDSDTFLRTFYGEYMSFPSLEHRAPMAYDYVKINPVGDVPAVIRDLTLGCSTKSRLGRIFLFMRLIGIRKFISIIRERYGRK